MLATPSRGGDAVNKNYVDKSHKVTTSGTVTRGFILNDPNHNQRVSVKTESPNGDYILIADDTRIGLYNKTTSTWVGSISWGGTVVETAYGLIGDSADTNLKIIGSCSVTIYANGIARLDFSAKIVLDTPTTENTYNHGISPSLLVERNPNIPLIRPFDRAGTCYLYNPDGSYNTELMHYGGLFQRATYDDVDRFLITRVYKEDGSTGGWEESKMRNDMRIEGVAFGTVVN